MARAKEVRKAIKSASNQRKNIKKKLSPHNF
jgi:hypothetical protein